MIKDAELKRLKEIVGDKWATADSCIMDAYSFFMNPEVLNKKGGRFTPRPAAVVMPESTQQVSEIMRFCNQSGLMAKPFSTGFAVVGGPSRERVITLDLKRMNKIIDIDVKNQIAVVEPYVRATDLQTRLLPLGLNCHVVSAGGGHSVLASTTSAWGTSVNGPSMGYASRNFLGAELVLPTGEVLLIGSAGEGAGWFSPDGPGPGVARGITRGYQGAFGGLGVFTKCAIKLYRWDGPGECEVAGTNPDYYITEVPPRIALNGISFPSSQKMRDAGYLMGEAGLEYADFRTPAFFLTLGMTKNNEDLKAIWETGIFQKIGRYVLVNAIVGYSQGEFEWKMKTLKQILKETDGVILPTAAGPPAVWQMKMLGGLVKYFDDPLFLLRKMPFLQSLMSGTIAMMTPKQIQMESISKMWWVLVRHANNVQGTLRASQALSTTLGCMDSWDVGIAQSDWMAERKKDAMAKGYIVQDGGDLGCGGTFEDSHMGYLEGILLYSTKNPDSLKAADELVEAGAEACVKHAFGIPIAGFGVTGNAKLGPACYNYHEYMAKIKQALDPNTASDPYFYAEPYQPADEKK